VPLHTSALGELFVQLGLVPRHTRRLTFDMPADGALTLHYEVFVEGDDLEKLGQALLQAAQEQRERQRTREHP